MENRIEGKGKEGTERRKEGTYMELESLKQENGSEAIFGYLLKIFHNR